MSFNTSVIAASTKTTNFLPTSDVTFPSTSSKDYPIVKLISSPKTKTTQSSNNQKNCTSPTQQTYNNTKGMDWLITKTTKCTIVLQLQVQKK